MKVKLVEVKEVEEWKIEKILNKRKVRGVVKYLVQQKGFMAEHDSWEKEKNLENTKKLVAEFEKRMNVEVRRQKKLNLAEKNNFRRGELPGKYIAKILYGWDNRKFKDEYLRKLERNQKKWKGEDKMRKSDRSTSFFGSRNLEGGVMSDM